ncbi:MAG: rod shape-determining protein MreC [Balneola sp.]|nr:MAG: rod shape-determining protein MreC [Balneola sp.]
MRFRIFKVEHASDYIITALLLVCALTIAINRHQGGINTLRQASITFISLLEEPLSNIRIYRQALNTNTYLQRQNILLQDELSRLRAIEEENKELRELLNFQERGTYDMVPVSLVSKELNGSNNSFTIDAGSRHGIEAGMPIITSDGLIGKVILTSRFYSQGMPYFNNLFKVSAVVSETKSMGIVSWTGDNKTELVMDFVPKTIPVDSGFVIETSGFGNEFPPGIPIGYVVRTETEPGKDTQRIFLRPYTSLFNVAEGFVVRFEQDSVIQNLNEDYNELFR